MSGHRSMCRVELTPTEYSFALAREFSTVVPVDLRKSSGQFFTPIEVAQFMAKMARPSLKDTRILDAGAGTGILACALCEMLPRGSRKVIIDLYELDSTLSIACEEALRYSKSWILKNKDIKLEYTINDEDFILSNAEVFDRGLFASNGKMLYNIAIANPPYYKVSRNDNVAVVAQRTMSGQPNIYAIFMSTMAKLLQANGTMVTITPRSFSAGDYFKRFRKELFNEVIPEAVHLFHSRSEAFNDDKVLQENIILRLRKADRSLTKRVRISTSVGIKDLNKCNGRFVPLQNVILKDSPEAILNVPTDSIDDNIVDIVQCWDNSLQKMQLEVSTGPVVPFRATEYLTEFTNGDRNIVPLVWPTHVKPMFVTWPISDYRKPQGIRTEAVRKRLLIPRNNYILVRRFTAKEQHRRVIAGPLFRDLLPGDLIGIENHVNYVWKPSGDLSVEEVFGISALLNSSLIDRYIRISNGSTQINASELRSLPLPPRSKLETIGRLISQNNDEIDSEECQNLAYETIKLPSSIRRMLSK